MLFKRTGEETKPLADRNMYKKSTPITEEIISVLPHLVMLSVKQHQPEILRTRTSEVNFVRFVQSHNAMKQGQSSLACVSSTPAMVLWA